MRNVTIEKLCVESQGLQRFKLDPLKTIPLRRGKKEHFTMDIVKRFFEKININ